MKLLKEALVDYDLILLQGIAAKRGLEPPANRNPERLTAFCEALLSPVSVAIVLDDLTPDEQAALDALVAQGNVMDAARFGRQFGEIRSMGSNRMLRETPWNEPLNTAEGLWYRGLIFKGFQHTLNGPEEIVFIPDDLQANLPLPPAENPQFQVALASPPTHSQESHLSAREDLFMLLVYLQTNPPQWPADDEIPLPHLTPLLEQLSYRLALEHTEVGQHWLAFLFHLGRRLNFFSQQGSLLRLNTRVVRGWLQKSAGQQIQQLQAAWRSDPTWNDLWHVPGLHPKPTGWDNSPLLGRAKILGYLAELSVAEWFKIDTFVRAIKKVEPEFQRPAGDFQSWYIYDAEGRSLMGFEHWDQIEGGLIRYLLTTMLYNLGMVDLGAPGDGLPPHTFRITALGHAFLQPDSKPLPTEARPIAPLYIEATKFAVRVPHNASLYDRFQLARFTQFGRREKGRVIYQITRARYLEALAQRITFEQIVTFLTRATKGQTPLAIVEALRTWGTRADAVKLEQHTILRVNNPALTPELLNHPEIAPLLGQPLGTDALLVPEANVAELRRLLVAHGYLE